MLNKEELLAINGGAIKIGAIALIAGGIAFVVGLIDGYVRMLPCKTK